MLSYPQLPWHAPSRLLPNPLLGFGTLLFAHLQHAVPRLCSSLHHFCVPTSLRAAFTSGSNPHLIAHFSEFWTQAIRESEAATAQLAEAQRSSAALSQQLGVLTAAQQGQENAAVISSEDADGRPSWPIQIDDKMCVLSS